MIHQPPCQICETCGRRDGSHDSDCPHKPHDGPRKRVWRKAISIPSMVERILNGTKVTTIRPVPEGRRPAVGDQIQFFRWTGRPYRSKQETIGGPMEITRVGEVTIDLGCIHSNGARFYGDDMLASVAKNDGFDSWAEMQAWFDGAHGLPFTGLLIGWEAPKKD
jgi:hypothetical protein